MAMGRSTDAAGVLREASQLNPMSMIVKVDRARAAWFAGDSERAIDDANYLIDRFENHLLARGLLVDIYESQQRFSDAAALHDSFAIKTGKKGDQIGASEYFAERKLHLKELPYGPFGERANRAIWETRVPPGIGDAVLAEMVDPMPPMIPLLLAAHPSFEEVRSLDRAMEVLPPRVD